MKKKITALLSVLAMIVLLIPSAYASTFTNEAFVGYYLSAGATEDNFGSLEIINCNDSTVDVKFRFVKNGTEQLVYTCSEGTMNDTIGTIRFNVHYQDGRYVSQGTMILTLEEWCVKVSCDSDQGQHLFDGTMKPQFELNPHAEVAPPPSNTPVNGKDVTVMLNGNDIVFPENINPYIINNYTYVPLRSVFDLMGINVYWDQYQKNELLSAQTITCTKNNAILQFSRTFNEHGYNAWSLSKWENSTTNYPHYQYIDIAELQPVLIGDSSYVPLRVISEAFGAVVDWEDVTRTVIIACDTSNTYKYDTDTISKMEDFSLDIAKSYITDDFTSIVQYNTPYFAPECKFYLFDAKDQWGNVTLRINYGGYIDVIPKEDLINDSMKFEENSEEINAPLYPTDDIPEQSDINDINDITDVITETPEEIVYDETDFAPLPDDGPEK